MPTIGCARQCSRHQGSTNTVWDRYSMKTLLLHMHCEPILKFDLKTILYNIKELQHTRMHKHKYNNSCTSGKVSFDVCLSVNRLDLRKDLRSPFSIYGNTIRGTWFCVSKQMPKSSKTLQWSNPCISAGSAMKSSISSRDEASVEFKYNTKLISS